jgi:beta-glucosidase
MATRILAAWYLLNQDSGYPATNFNSWNTRGGINQNINVQGNHKEYVEISFTNDAVCLMLPFSIIRTIGAASTVLLKNTNGALPLKAPRTLAIIGSHAGASSRGPNGYVLNLVGSKPLLSLRS